LRKKAEEICSSQGRILIQSFELKEDARVKGYISAQNFRSILISHNTGLSPSEIDKIIVFIYLLLNIIRNKSVREAQPDL
jgi:hypothetical protein